MKSKIHTHSWADSTNESCSFCGKDMKYCTSPNCYLYMCKNKVCRQTVKIKRGAIMIETDIELMNLRTAVRYLAGEVQRLNDLLYSSAPMAHQNDIVEQVEEKLKHD